MLVQTITVLRLASLIFYYSQVHAGAVPLVYQQSYQCNSMCDAKRATFAIKYSRWNCNWYITILTLVSNMLHCNYPLHQPGSFERSLFRTIKNHCIWLLKQLVCVWERIIVDSLKWNELTETLTIQIRRGLPAAAARTYKKDVDVTTSTWMVHWWMQRHRVQRSASEPPGNGSQFRKDCSFLVKLIGKCLHKKVIHKLICLGCTVDSSCSCRLGPKSTGHLRVL